MFDKTPSDQMTELAGKYAASPEMHMLAIHAAGIFGANVKRVREALGLSRDELAASLGLGDKHLARIEAGVAEQVKLDLIVLMTKQLKVSYADLLEGIS
jgi:ribosome-binding protein aMBF1 (putative translation factor)